MADSTAALLRDIQVEWRDPNKSNGERQKVLEAAQQLVAELTSPEENVKRLTYYWPLMLSAARACIDMDLFNRLVANNGRPKSATDLAASCEAEPRLVERFLKHLVNGNIVDEARPAVFAPNNTTRLYATPEASGLIIDMHDGFGKVLPGLSEFLRKTHYQNPLDDKSSLFKSSTGIDSSFFEWLFQPGNEARQNAFHRHMAFMAMGPKWHETVPLDEVLGPQDDTSPDEPLIVDLGGGTGHDIIGFHHAHPERRGRLILQDQEATIQSLDAKSIAPVEAMAHDFFKPQPIQEAKAYFLKRTLHDWNDESCRQILANIKQAMKPGYSKILVNEVVVPDIGADWFSTGIDLVMMVAQSAQERKEEEWRELATSTGLRVSKIWTCGDAAERLIEIVLA